MKKSITPDQTSREVQQVLKNLGCSSAKVAIMPSQDVSEYLSSYKFVIGVLAKDAIEIDKIQAVFAGVEICTFLEWQQADTGDLLVYGFG